MLTLALATLTVSNLVYVVFTLIIIGVVLYLVKSLPMDPTIKTVINIIVVLSVCLWLLDWAGVVRVGG